MWKAIRANIAIWIRSYERSPAENVNIENCIFNNVAEANVLENVRNISLVGVKLSLAVKSAGK